MNLPEAYNPQEGYKYQIFSKLGDLSWEHYNYAKTTGARDYLTEEARVEYGDNFSFKSILLPVVFWPPRGR